MFVEMFMKLLYTRSLLTQEELFKAHLALRYVVSTVKYAWQFKSKNIISGWFLSIALLEPSCPVVKNWIVVATNNEESVAGLFQVCRKIYYNKNMF